MLRRATVFGFVVSLAAMTTGKAAAQAHYVPGVMFIREFSAPPPGFNAGAYDYFYSSSRLNDVDGNEVTSITIGGQAYDISVNIGSVALLPFLIWSPERKVLGAQFAAIINPSFANTNLNGLVFDAFDAGRSVSAGQFNVGDLWVEPIWLTWSGEHYSGTYAFSFYAPIGKYDTTIVTLPDVGAVSIASPDNVGLGFWTFQNQGVLYLYPWADRRAAVLNALTWEINTRKKDLDVTPGQYLTWNWGIDMYLPLKKDASVLLEVGPAGYGTFQVTDDTGAGARNPGDHDHVYAAGLQVGITDVKRRVVANFHWMQEFGAVDRFQGAAFSFDIILSF